MAPLFDPNTAPPKPMSRDERIFLFIFLGLVFGLLVMEVVMDYEPVKLGMVLFPFFWAILIGIHEAGHAIAANMCGWSVGGVVVGMGKPVSAFHVSDIPVEVRIIPVEGFTRLEPRDSWSRLSAAFIYFAGPGIELLVAGLVIGWIGWDAFIARNEDYGVIALQTFGGAALAGAILNLIPAAVHTQNGIVPNDGLGIIRSLFGTVER